MKLEAVAAESVEGAERRGAAWNLSVINLQSRYPILDALADFGGVMFFSTSGLETHLSIQLPLAAWMAAMLCAS